MPRLKNPPPFNSGDIVRLKNGAAPQEVRALQPHASCSGHWLLKAHYLTDPFGEIYPSVWRAASDYVKLDPDTLEDLVAGEDKPKRKNDMPKLYQVNAETDTFGTFLAHNSEGQIVLEMKGDGGKVRAFNKSDLTEVKPYTVATIPQTGSAVPQGFRASHHRVKKGSVAVGDLLIFNGGVLKVTEINTGANTNSTLKGARKLVTEALPDAEDIETGPAATDGDDDEE